MSNPQKNTPLPFATVNLFLPQNKRAKDWIESQLSTTSAQGNIVFTAGGPRGKIRFLYSGEQGVYGVDAEIGPKYKGYYLNPTRREEVPHSLCKEVIEDLDRSQDALATLSSIDTLPTTLVFQISSGKNPLVNLLAHWMETECTLLWAYQGTHIDHLLPEVKHLPSLSQHVNLHLNSKDYVRQNPDRRTGMHITGNTLSDTLNNAVEIYEAAHKYF